MLCRVPCPPAKVSDRSRGDGAGENSRLLSLLRSLRSVLSEQSVIGPSALFGTLLPGLNNECAGLPLALRALIISQGPVFSHVQESEAEVEGSTGLNMTVCQQMLPPPSPFL